MKKMLDIEIIRSKSSPLSSHVVLVKKNDHSWRMCKDYKRLNGIMIKNKYSFPFVDELINEL